MGPGTLLDAGLQLPWWKCILIPLGGAIIASLLKYGLTRNRASQGMVGRHGGGDPQTGTQPERGGDREARDGFVFFSFSTGGSIGREGPIAYMAASFGARFSKLVRVPEQHQGLFCGLRNRGGDGGVLLRPAGSGALRDGDRLRQLRPSDFSSRS